jgi:hypothetical protein
LKAGTRKGGTVLARSKEFQFIGKPRSKKTEVLATKAAGPRIGLTDREVVVEVQ